MNHRLLPAVLALLVSAGPALAAPGETNAQLQGQVRDTERAFAKTMADRNHAAFATFLSEEAVFFSSTRVLRGKTEVAEDWQPLFEGPKPPFSWEPAEVEVLASGTLAFSSGPVRDPGGKQVGTFNSVWRREPDGRWRIVFDKGCPRCTCP